MDPTPEDVYWYEFYCFSTVTVNEYIVGTGPPELVAIMHREIIRKSEELDWEQEEEVYMITLSDPRARTAAAFEGRELVMWLMLPISIAVEAWDADAKLGRWFVQRDDPGDIRAVVAEIARASEAQRSAWDVPLDDLVADFKAADAARTAYIDALDSGDTDSDSSTTTASDGSSTTTTVAGLIYPPGGLGREARLPVLITDANRLRDAYVELGAVYEGDDATTVMPPPEPSAPGVRPMS